MEILFLLAGILLGGLIVWFYANAQKSRQLENAINNHPVSVELRNQRDQFSAEWRNERAEKEKIIASASSSRQEIESLREKLRTQTDELNLLREQFSREFQNVANAILEKNSEKFSKQNKEQIEGILTPLRERIKEFEGKVEKTYDEEKGERIRLKKEIEDLVMLNKKLSTDAENLTTALKGDNKMQGNWGELILEKILERSGLREGMEYEVQHHTTNTQGSTIRPDVVIFLPDSKHLIVDSKVSLNAYQSMIGVSDEEVRLRLMKQHVDSLRNHIKGLGEKSYHTAGGLHSPDFVLMFLPVEAAFSAAMQADPELFNFAWDRKIVLVSPTTLLATLRTVDNIWSQEKRTQNAERIADEAGKLYDKFASFVGDLIDLGKKMGQARESYEESMKKLSTGTGNLVSRAEKMKKLGAKSTKSMHEKLLERSVDSDTSETVE